MLNVTDRALDVLADAVGSREVSEDEVLRLSQTGTNEFGLVLDQPREDDQVVVRDEQKLLYVDGQVSSALDGATLDVIEDGEKTRLTLKLPDAGA